LGHNSTTIFNPFFISQTFRHLVNSNFQLVKEIILLVKSSANFGQTKKLNIMKTQKFNWLLVCMLLAVLKSFEVSATPQLITTEIIGKGQPMILIHGMSCSSEV
jgi:hypothetical protein